MSMSILSPERLQQQVPAVFAEAPDRAVSKRYGFVPTMRIVEALREEGWYPVHARQTQPRVSERLPVVRHMIRFRQAPDRQIAVGDCVTELVLTNSHDRSASYQLDLGLFRLVCLNGMVTPVGDMGGIRVRHGRQVVEEILDGSLALVEAVPRIADAVERFRCTLVSDVEAHGFAEAALALRYGEDWQRLSPVTPRAVLEARRVEDRDGTLWSVFNRTQENLFKGGLPGRTIQGRRTRTRPIRSVTEDVRLNRALWKLTEHFAALKGMAMAG